MKFALIFHFHKISSQRYYTVIPTVIVFTHILTFIDSYPPVRFQHSTVRGLLILSVAAV